MQDPYFAVKEEVEHSVTVVVDLHKRWEELSQSKKKSDEWEWTACARSLWASHPPAAAREDRVWPFAPFLFFCAPV